MLAEKPPRVISREDIQRATKQVTDLREDLRRCMNRVEANRNGGHLLDNTVRESFRLSQAIKKAVARLQTLKDRRDEASRASEATVPAVETVHA
jgi:hypothetical protein